MNFKENLKKIRKENNLSQEQIAERLGVSRQSVSKWESGQAYPEMDKMLQLCEMFNLNIDDLLNQNINEVRKNKQSKININKYIDDFLEYVTKTIDMFSSMKVKQKIKCLIEQCFIFGMLSLVLLILGLPLSSIFHNIFSFIPSDIYYNVYNIFSGIYLLVCIIIVVVFTLHIFKVRYLDYYEVVKQSIEDINKEEKEDLESKQNKIILEKKQEKIVIRDPKHSEYKFISGLLNALLFIIKLIVGLFGLMFCASLIIFVICFVLLFLFVETGLLFIGALLAIIGIIIINLIILSSLYNFIISNRINKKIYFIIFIISLILTSIGIGIGMIGITQFDYIENIEETDLYTVVNKEIEMTDDLIFYNYDNSNVEYKESLDENIRLEIICSKFSDIYINNHVPNEYYVESYFKDELRGNFIRQIIKDINSEKIVRNYGEFKITIYTKKENIEKIKQNIQNHYNSEEERQNIINEYERQISDYRQQIIKLEEQLNY